MVAGSTNVTVTLGSGDNANLESLPLPAYRGVPASLAPRLARVPAWPRPPANPASLTAPSGPETWTWSR